MWVVLASHMNEWQMTEEFNTKFANVAATSLTVSRIGLGTWAIGGWMWGGTDEEESVKTIRAAVERGITLIDTAPAYGFGRSEEIVGRALVDAGLRSRVVIATKVGLEWKDGKVHRNASRNRILREATDSLQRLNSDYIDIYQVHWPDPLVPIEETAEAMQTLFDQGKIRAFGLLPASGLTTLTYGALCRGLLSSKLQEDAHFDGDDLRLTDPKFRSPRFAQYLI